MKINHNQTYRLQVREDYISKHSLFSLHNPILHVKIENINSYNIAFSLINDKVNNEEVKYIIIPHSQIEFLVPINKKQTLISS